PQAGHQAPSLSVPQSVCQTRSWSRSTGTTAEPPAASRRARYTTDVPVAVTAADQARSDLLVTSHPLARSSSHRLLPGPGTGPPLPVIPRHPARATNLDNALIQGARLAI